MEACATVSALETWAKTYADIYGAAKDAQVVVAKDNWRKPNLEQIKASLRAFMSGGGTPPTRVAAAQPQAGSSSRYAPVLHPL
jgi:hypothetical protein